MYMHTELYEKRDAGWKERHQPDLKFRQNNTPPHLRQQHTGCGAHSSAVTLLVTGQR